MATKFLTCLEKIVETYAKVILKIFKKTLENKYRGYTTAHLQNKMGMIMQNKQKILYCISVILKYVDEEKISECLLRKIDFSKCLHPHKEYFLPIWRNRLFSDQTWLSRIVTAIRSEYELSKIKHLH